MLVILVSVVIALVLYLFVYVRTELFRITERQSNTLIHIARMHRGLLGGIANMLQPSTLVASEDEIAPDAELATVVEEVDNEDDDGAEKS